MTESGVFLDFLHNSHVFASIVRQIFEEKYLRMTSDLGLSRAQFSLLRLVGCSGDHQIRQIADFMGVSPAAASKNVDKLVRLGLIVRQVQAVDRRATSLSLTIRGRNIVEKYEALIRERLQGIFDELMPDELGALTKGLGKLSYLILKEERDVEDICMMCDAHYAESCPLRSLSDGCIYLKDRESTVS